MSAIPTHDPTDRYLEEAMHATVFAFRVHEDFPAARIRFGEIVIIRRMTTVEADGDQYVITVATPDGSRTAIYRLYRLDDGLVEARDEDDVPHLVGTEASLDIQGRVLTVIRHV